MIVLIYGTRPEAIKLGPVAAELKAAGVPFLPICTNQHTDLLKGTPAETDLADGDSLGLASSGDVLRWTFGAERELTHRLQKLAPEVVVVQGDTMSALAGARAAHSLGTILCHVEAGVRSGCLEEPWPEEGIRREITELADWHYAATEHAAENLRQEGIPEERLQVTGNPGVSALARYSDATPMAEPCTPTILVTLHRRELVKGPHFAEVLQSLGDTADEFPALRFVWPKHPAIDKEITGIPNFRTIAPLPYRTCVNGLALSVGVLTDSGGLQEDAAHLGIPCAVLRNYSDRPESIAAGVAKLFPPTAQGVRGAVRALATESIPRKPAPVFGDALSAFRIAEHLASLVTVKV